jgi:hypothetical protein
MLDPRSLSPADLAALWPLLVEHADAVDDYATASDRLIDRRRTRDQASAALAAMTRRIAERGAGERDGWQPVETLTTDGHYLVYLQRTMLGSQIHTCRVVRGKPTTVGSVFHYDAPPITHWRPLPDGPRDATPEAPGAGGEG